MSYLPRVSTASSKKPGAAQRPAQRPCSPLRSKWPGDGCTDQEPACRLALVLGLFTSSALGHPRMRRSRSTSPALPPLSINSQPQPVCLPGLAFRSRGQAGGSVLSCGELMRGTQHRARHTVGALDLFISTLWTRISQRQRWHQHKGLWASGVGEDQKKLPGGGGLGSSRGRSGAALSRPTRFVLFFFYKFIYLFIFIFGCVGSSFLCEGFL